MEFFQIIGFLGLILITLSWQLKKREYVLALNALAFLVFCIELFPLGAIVGAWMMLFAAIRTFIAIYTQSTLVRNSLIALALGLGLLVFNNWHDLFPIFSNIMGIITFFCKDMKNVRLLAPIGTISWAIHNLIVGAWGQLCADVLILGSMLVGEYRQRNRA